MINNSSGPRRTPPENRLTHAQDLLGRMLAEFGAFFDSGEREICPARMILIAPGEPADKLYILRQGRVHLFRTTPNGKRLVTREVTAGSVFGFVGLLSQSTQGNYYAETIDDSIVSIINREQAIGVLKQHPEVTLLILESLANRLLAVEEDLMQAIYCPLTARLSNFLIVNSDSQSGIISDFTHEEIADIMGAARQTVTETLHLLQNKGLIFIERKRIRIIDWQGLKNVVGTWR